jgi:hypothetical protein
MAATERRKELAQDAPAAEVLGTVPVDSTLTNPTPHAASAEWQTTSGSIGVTEPPPPWELTGGDMEMSDARKFVRVPDTWTLRWMNPKLLDSQGWRYWQAVSASDPRVTVLVDTMVAPDGIIRRGGHTGDILAWMYTSWVDSARERLRKRTEEQAASAVNKQAELREEMRRGTFGPNIRLEEARHPTHTIADGRSLKD